MKCEKCGGRNKNVGNNRNVKVRTLEGIKFVNISQLKCLECGKYSSSKNDYAPKNMSLGHDVIELVRESRKTLTREQVKSRLKYRHGFDIGLSTLARIDGMDSYDKIDEGVK